MKIGKSIPTVVLPVLAVSLVFAGISRSAPDPTNSFYIVAYHAPWPVNPDSFPQYDYQYLVDAGFDAIAIFLGAAPGNPPVSTDRHVWYGPQADFVQRASETNPPLYVLVARQNRTDNPITTYGVVGQTPWTGCQDCPLYDTVRTQMSASAFLNAENILGWYLWDEPGSIYISDAKTTDLFVRRSTQSLGADTTWTTFWGWFGLGYHNAVIEDMLEYMDQNADDPNPGVGSRPIFGLETYRYRKNGTEYDALYDCSTGDCGCTDACVSGKCHHHCCGQLAIVWVNQHLYSHYNTLRSPARKYGTNPEMYPWWGILNVTDFPGNCSRVEGPPSEEALRIDVFTQIAWGAKGISYYLYVHGGGEWGDPASAEHWPGVFKSDPSDPTAVDPNDNFNDTYDWISSINHDIQRLKPIIGPARIKRPVVAAPYDTSTWGSGATYRTLNSPSSFVDSMSIEGGGAYTKKNALATPMVVGTGESARKYILAVNQWETDEFTNEAGGPLDISIMVVRDSLSGSGSYLVATDTLNDRILIADDFVIEDHLATGEAKMYKVERWDGADLTVPNGYAVKVLTTGVTLSGSIAIGSNVTWEGPIAFANNATVTCSSGSFAFPDDVTVGTNVTWSGAFTIGDGTNVTNGSGPLKITGGADITVSKVKWAGDITVDGSGSTLIVSGDPGGGNPWTSVITVKKMSTLSITSGGRIRLSDASNYHVSLRRGTVDGAGKSVSTLDGRVSVDSTGINTVQEVTINWPDSYGTGYAAIEFTSGKSGSVTDCAINGSPNEYNVVGVRCTSVGPGISGTTFQNLDIGVYAYNGSDPWLYRSGTDCGDVHLNNVFESTVVYGLYGYVGSEFNTGASWDDRVGANYFLRPNNGSATANGGHGYFRNTSTQYLDLNRWKGGADIYLYPGTPSPELIDSCTTYLTRPSRDLAIFADSSIFAEINTAYEPVKTGDTTTATTNLLRIAERQTDGLNMLFALDRLVSINRRDVAETHVRDLRNRLSSIAARQATAYILSNLLCEKGQSPEAADMLSSARITGGNALLNTESLFARAEILREADDLGGVAELYRTYLDETPEDSPNRRIAEARLQSAGVVERATANR